MSGVCVCVCACVCACVRAAEQRGGDRGGVGAGETCAAGLRGRRRAARAAANRARYRGARAPPAEGSVARAEQERRDRARPPLAGRAGAGRLKEVVTLRVGAIEGLVGPLCLCVFVCVCVGVRARVFGCVFG